MIALQSRRFRLNRASTSDVEWLCKLLNNICASFGTYIRLGHDNTMTLRR